MASKQAFLPSRTVRAIVAVCACVCRSGREAVRGAGGSGSHSPCSSLIAMAPLTRPKSALTGATKQVVRLRKSGREKREGPRWAAGPPVQLQQLQLVHADDERRTGRDRRAQSAEIEEEIDECIEVQTGVDENEGEASPPREVEEESRLRRHDDRARRLLSERIAANVSAKESPSAAWRRRRAAEEAGVAAQEGGAAAETATAINANDSRRGKGCGDATFKGDAIAMNQATPQAGGSLGSRHARTTNAAAHNGFIEAMVQGCRGHRGNADLLVAGFGVLSLHAANSAANQKAVADKNGIQVVLEGMREHATHPLVQEAGSWALCSICSGDETLLERLQEADGEACLRAAVAAPGALDRTRTQGQQLLESLALLACSADAS